MPICRNAGSLTPAEYSLDLCCFVHSARAYLPLSSKISALAALETASQGMPVCLNQEDYTGEHFDVRARYVDSKSVDFILKELCTMAKRKHSPELAKLARSSYIWDNAVAQQEALWCYVRKT